MEAKISVEEIEHYLSDLDNLIETGHFSREGVKDHTFYHKDMVLKEFVSKGREFIRQLLIFTPTASIESDTQCMDAEELREHYLKIEKRQPMYADDSACDMIYNQGYSRWLEKQVISQFASQHKPQIPSEEEIFIAGYNEGFESLLNFPSMAYEKWALSQTKK